MELKTLKDFELFLTRKYNSGELSAKEFSEINILIGEFGSGKLKQKLSEASE